MAAYIALFIALVSLILMVVILIRFKKLFSTDAIIDKTKKQMNRVIMDVNNNASRDMELINESTKRLRALLNEADKKMENFREATQILRNVIAEAEKLSPERKENPVFVENKNIEKKSTYVDPDAAYRVTDKGPAKQGTLFDDNDLLKDETIVTPDGAAFKEVPVIAAKVYDEKPGAAGRAAGAGAQGSAGAGSTSGISNAGASKVISFGSVKTDKPLKEKVERLFNQGMQVDAIAEELSCPATEVQFIIDML